MNDHNPDAAPCTNHFSDGSKIFPNRDCCDRARIAELERLHLEAIDEQAAQVNIMRELERALLIERGEVAAGKSVVKDLDEEVAQLRATLAQVTKERDDTNELISKIVTAHQAGTTDLSPLMNRLKPCAIPMALTLIGKELADSKLTFQDCYRDIASKAATIFELRETVDSLRAQLAASEADRWKPIETAPKDGTVIVLWCPSSEWRCRQRNDSVTIGYWHQPGNEEMPGYWVSGTLHYTLRPTHWQPLPQPPQ